MDSSVSSQGTKVYGSLKQRPHKELGHSVAGDVFRAKGLSSDRQKEALSCRWSVLD